MSSRTEFRAILWKETREGTKAGAAAFVVVAVALWLAASINVESNTVVMETASPVSVFTFVAALAGTLIGIAQFARENRGDAWAFLTHRPVQRSTLFWGKTAAAFFWYIAAVGLPMVTTWVWRAQTGHHDAPFVPRMLLPQAVDFLIGFVFVFAGQVTMLRHARWYASRTLPLISALVWLLGVTSIDRVGEALVNVAVGLVGAAVAARATFVAGGYDGTMFPSGRAALAAVMWPCAMAIIAIAAGLIGNIDYTRAQLPPILRTTYAELARDGSLVRQVTLYDRSSGESSTIDIQDLDGRSRPDLFDTTRVPHLAAQEDVVASAVVPLNPGADYPNAGRHGYRGTLDLFAEISGPASFDRDLLYYRKDEGLIDVYRHGMHPRHVGWMGPDGYVAGDAMPARRFEGTLRPYAEWENAQPFVVLPHEVYRVNASQRTIRRVFTTGSDEEITGAAGTGDSAAVGRLGAAAQFDVIATTKSIYVQGRDGTRQVVLPLDSSTARDGAVTVMRALRAPDASSVIWFRSQYGKLPRVVADTTKDIVFRIAADGGVTARTVLAGSTGFAPQAGTAWVAAAMRGTAQSVAGIALGLFEGAVSPEPFWGVEASKTLTYVSWAVALLAAFIAMIFVWRRAKRDSLSIAQTRAWLAAALLFGLTIPLVMLAVLDRPARVPCPSCRKDRLVTRDTCEHCGAPFAPPPMEGIEVFESAA